MKFNRDLAFTYGIPDSLSPLIRRVIAENPSPFTFHGTGTYIVGRGRVAVIDPGPALTRHVDALMRALDGEEVSHILITHTHIDHSPAAADLKARTGAPTYGFGAHGSGHVDDGVKVEEGGDMDFTPDVAIGDGDAIAGDGWTLQALHTPGHTSNHLCFALAEENALFPGDHVMGWSTTVVSPPDGDMAAYMASLAKLAAHDAEIYYPTHGAPIQNPGAYVRALLGHRRKRAADIGRHLATGVTTIPDLVRIMYANTDPRLHRAAGSSVLAHLIEMVADGRATTDGTPTLDSIFGPGNS